MYVNVPSSPNTNESARPREIVVREHDRYWAIDNLPAGSVGHTYGEGDLRARPDPDRAGSVQVDIRDPLSRDERAVVARNPATGRYEARVRR